MVVETFDALVSERGDTGKIWASLLKDTLKRRRPDFSETYYGFRTFGNLLEDAQTRGLFEFGRDEKSGTYVYRSTQAVEALGAASDTEQTSPESMTADGGALDRGDELAAEMQGEQPSEIPAAAPAREPRRRGGRGRKGREQGADQAGAVADVQAAPQDMPEDAGMASWPAPTPDLVEADDNVAAALTAAQPEAAGTGEAAAEQPAAPAKERRRAPRKPAARKGAAAKAVADTVDVAAPVVDTAAAEAVAANADLDAVTDADPSDPAPADGKGAKERKPSTRSAHKAPSRKPAARARRPAKPKTPEGA
jgi:hypothetical protein